MVESTLALRLLECTRELGPTSVVAFGMLVLGRVVPSCWDGPRLCETFSGLEAVENDFVGEGDRLGGGRLDSGLGAYNFVLAFGKDWFTEDALDDIGRFIGLSSA